MSQIADVSYNIASEEYIDTPFPSTQSAAQQDISKPWKDHIGTYRTFTVLDKNNTKITYLQLNSDNFEMTLPASKFNGDFIRKLSTNTRSYIKDNAPVTTIHKYNTRSSHKYKNNISVVFKSIDENTISLVLNSISTFYPDISNYYARIPENGNHSVLLQPFVTENQTCIRFLGSVSSIANILHSGYVYVMLNNLLDEIEETEEPVRLSEVEFNSIVTNTVADKSSHEEQCSICLSGIIENDSISVTPCNHVFHTGCLKKWLTEDCLVPSCPYCRKDLRHEV